MSVGVVGRSKKRKEKKRKGGGGEAEGGVGPKGAVGARGVNRWEAGPWILAKTSLVATAVSIGTSEEGGREGGPETFKLFGFQNARMSGECAA